ncbi:MAG: hypothetical protein JSU88_10915 [Nitrospinaceae bacterium]|jgi:hypothetical protein|nr:MAG: hypothetical protein JSU88_10915 [Nitrospinaceae bacterium]
MKSGDKIKLNFAGKPREAVVHKVFPNSVHLKMDFDNHKGKIVKRKLQAVAAKPAKKKSKEK